MADAEHKKALQSEMVAVKTRWSDEVKLSKAKDSPTAPFPVTLQRTIPKPEAASAFDVEELRLQLRSRRCHRCGRSLGRDSGQDHSRNCSAATTAATHAAAH